MPRRRVMRLAGRRRQRPWGWWPTTINPPTVCGSGGLVCPPGTVCVQGQTSNACVYPDGRPAVTQLRVGGAAMPHSVFYQGGYSPGTITAAEYHASMAERVAPSVRKERNMSDPNAHFGRAGNYSGLNVRSPPSSLSIGAPISAHDAAAMIRVLEQHGYRVTGPHYRNPQHGMGSRKRKRKGGLLVGFAKALTGGR